MRVATSVIQEDFGQYMDRRKESSGSYQFIQAGFVQLSQDFPVSVRTRSTDFVWLSKTLGYNVKKNLLSVSVKKGAKQVFKVIGEGDYLPLELKDYRVSKEILE